MSEMMQNAGKSLIVYKMAILIGVLFSINALMLAIIAALTNVEWEHLTPTSKFLVYAVILANWTSTMLAYFNKTLARIEQGQPPVPTGDTQQFVLPKPAEPAKPNP